MKSVWQEMMDVKKHMPRAPHVAKPSKKRLFKLGKKKVYYKGAPEREWYRKL